MDGGAREKCGAKLRRNVKSPRTIIVIEIFRQCVINLLIRNSTISNGAHEHIFVFTLLFLRAAFRHRPSHINSFPSIAGRQHRRLRSNPTLLFNVDFLTASVCADCTYAVGTRLKVRFEGVTGNYVAARAFLYLQTALQSASYWHCLCTETKRLQRYLCVAYIKSCFNRRK